MLKSNVENLCCKAAKAAGKMSFFFGLSHKKYDLKSFLVKLQGLYGLRLWSLITSSAGNSTTGGVGVKVCHVFLWERL